MGHECTENETSSQFPRFSIIQDFSIIQECRKGTSRYLFTKSSKVFDRGQLQGRSCLICIYCPIARRSARRVHSTRAHPRRSSRSLYAPGQGRTKREKRIPGPGHADLRVSVLVPGRRVQRPPPLHHLLLHFRRPRISAGREDTSIHPLRPPSALCGLTLLLLVLPPLPSISSLITLGGWNAFITRPFSLQTFGIGV